MRYIQVHITVRVKLRVEKYFKIGYGAIIETTRISYRHTFTIRLKADNYEARFLKLRRCPDSPHMTGERRK